MHAQVGPRIIEVNLDGVVSHWNHPKHVVPVYVHVVVVNLLGETGRSNRTGIHVKSNKGERASVLLAVRTDEFALTETHIGLERQPRGGARRGICSCPAATRMRLRRLSQCS